MTSAGPWLPTSSASRAEGRRALGRAPAVPGGERERPPDVLIARSIDEPAPGCHDPPSIADGGEQVSAGSGSEADLEAEAVRVLDAAQAENVLLRALGGLAVKLICPSAGVPPLARSYKDLDLATRHAES